MYSKYASGDNSISFVNQAKFIATGLSLFNYSPNLNYVKVDFVSS